MGQQHAREPARVVRLAAVQPQELHDGEGGHRHGAAGSGPGAPPVDLSRSASPRRERPPCRSRAWPGGRPAGPVEHDHAVLLAGDRDRPARRAPAAPSRRRTRPTRPRVLLAAGGVRGGWGGGHPMTHTRVGVAHFDLGGLGGESTPATSGIPGGLRRAGPAQRPPARWWCSGAGVCVSAVICASRGPWEGPWYEGRPRGRMMRGI